MAEELKDHYILSYEVGLHQPHQRGVNQVMTLYIQHPCFPERYELANLDFTDVGTIIQYQYLPITPIITKEQLYGSLWVLCHLFKSVMGKMGGGTSVSLDETLTSDSTPPRTFDAPPITLVEPYLADGPKDPESTPPDSNPPEKTVHYCPGANPSDDVPVQDCIRDPSLAQVLESGESNTAFKWI